MPATSLTPAAVRLRLLDWASLHAHVEWVYEGRPGTFSGTFDQSESIKAWLMLQGRVRVTAASRRLEVSSGNWLVTPTGVVRQDFSPDARLLSVRFHATWPTGDSLIRGIEPIVLPAGLHRTLEVRARRLERLVRRHFRGARNHLLEASASLGIYLKVESLFADWLAAFADALLASNQLVFPPSPHDARVLTAVQQIDRWPVREPFSVAVIAARAGLSASQIDRLFIRDLQVTPRRYFELHRLNFARAGLVNPSQSVKELAYRLGFRQASHFSTWFRQQTGLSPKAYRQSLAGTLTASLSQTAVVIRDRSPRANKEDQP